MPSEKVGAVGVAVEVEASATATLRQIYRPNLKALLHKQGISQDLRRLVAVSEGAIVGTTQYLVDGDAMRIVGLGVHCDIRRQGVARALVIEVSDRACRLGLSAVVTRTVEETGNVPILEALGFRVESRRPDKYSEGVTGGQVTDVSLTIEMANGRRAR